jgi:hypothetical protein
MTNQLLYYMGKIVGRRLNMTVFGALLILAIVGCFVHAWSKDGGRVPPSNRWEPNDAGGYDAPAGFTSYRHDFRDHAGNLTGYLQVLPTRTEAYTKTGSYKGYYCHTTNQTFDHAGNLVGYGNQLHSLIP